jgi:hypothetical protein
VLYVSFLFDLDLASDVFVWIKSLSGCWLQNGERTSFCSFLFGGRRMGSGAICFANRIASRSHTLLSVNQIGKLTRIVIIIFLLTVGYL